MPWGLSLRPAPRLSRAIVRWRPRQGQPLQVPAVLVGAEALDQQHRRAAAATGDLVVDAGPVGRRRIRHLSSRPSPQREPVEQRPGLRAAELVEQPLDPLLGQVGQLELDERTAPTASGTDARADLDARRPAERRARRGRREHRGARRHRGADQRVVDAPDAAGVQGRRRRHHEQLAGPQRAGDLVGPGEQSTEAPGEGADRRDVRPADEAGRATGLPGDGEGGLDRRPATTGGC